MGSENKQVRILNETVVLFGEHGYAGTSLVDIVNAAGTSEAGLLHHFSSKDELFCRVPEHRDHEDALSILMESPATEGDAAEAPVDTIGNLDTLDVAGASGLDDNPRALLERYIELFECNIAHRDLTAIYAATVVSVFDVEHPAHRWMANHLDSAVEHFESNLEVDKTAGFVDPKMPLRLAAHSLVTLIDGLQLQWSCSTTPGTAATESLPIDLVVKIRPYADYLRSQWEVQETPEISQHPKAA